MKRERARRKNAGGRKVVSSSRALAFNFFTDFQLKSALICKSHGGGFSSLLTLLLYNDCAMSTETILVRSNAREEMVEITDEVRRCLKASGAHEGICVLYVQHTTAGLTVNENADPDVQRDMLLALRTLVPQHGMGFRHGEENSDAHIKASLIGPSVTVPFTGGELLLGRWQGIYLCEFDGPRERKVVMMLR